MRPATASKRRAFEFGAHADPRKRYAFSTASDDIPSATNRPEGCAFHKRCPLATDICRR
nr:hypothetical protein [Marinicella sp. W31]MDC2880048.1 hypothetical protein [Marinicella sp. W31]